MAMLAIFDGGFLGGVHFAERLFRCPAERLNLLRVAIQHLQDRQRLTLGGQLLGHAQGGKHGHRGVEADVVFAAEGFGVGQCSGSDQVLEIRFAAVELVDQDRLELIGRRALEQIDEGVVGAERERGVAFVGKGRGEAQLLGQRRARGRRPAFHIRRIREIRGGY